MESFRYKAFISYSHSDKAWSAWLQRALESYRVPKRLVGQEGEFGAIPRRLAPVFRDREDLPSASDLTMKVTEALEVSEALIVICSPAAAQSVWVNEEIRHFRSLGREDRIYALIVDGEPQAKNLGEQCFPTAIITGLDGSNREPLAADARKWADGKLLAKLKIISGILGIRLDDLRQRDMQRRQRLWMMSATSAVVIAVLMSVLAVVAVTARNAAENRREHAEDLVGYMVGDLRTKLEEAGRLDILEGMGGQVSDYLETLNPDEVTDESLTQQARVWRQLGEVGMDQGELDNALSAFSASRDILAELHRRNPNSSEFLFELGNAEFWVGYVHLETGEFERAENALGAYLGYAYQLVELEPDNPAWLMEKSYAHTNLAALIKTRGDSNVDAALIHISLAVAMNKRAVELAPDNQEFKGECGTSLAWLADTQLLVCDLGDALISRQGSLEIALEQVKLAPGNVNLKSRYAYALTGVGNVHSMVGLVEPALENYAEASKILGQLSILEPTNLTHRFDYLNREAYMASLLADAGRLDEALAQMEVLRTPMLEVLEGESFENMRRQISWAGYLLDWSEMNWMAGKLPEADEALAEAINQLGLLLMRESSAQSFQYQLMAARFALWQQHGEDLFGAPPFSDINFLFKESAKSCQDRVALVTQAILADEREKAKEFTTGLLNVGYYYPGFIRICRQYDLCQ